MHTVMNYVGDGMLSYSGNHDFHHKCIALEHSKAPLLITSPSKSLIQNRKEDSDNTP